MQRVKPELVFLDLDGTTVDSVPKFLRQVGKICSERGIPFGEKEDKTLRRHLGYPGAMAFMKALGVSSQIAEAMYEEIRRWEKSDPPGLVPDVHKMLNYCSANGIKVGMLTSRGRESTEKALFRGGIRFHFQERYTVCAGDTEFHKPDPGVFNGCLNDGRISFGKVVFVGDSMVDVECARAAGIQPVVVLTGAVYREDIDENPRFFEGVPIIDSIRDFPAWVNGK